MARPATEEAIAYLFRDNHLRMVRLAYLLTSDSGLAEEIAQEAFVKVWRNWGRIQKKGSAAAYLRTTVINLSKSSLRRRLLEMRKSLPEERPTPEPDTGARVDVGRALLHLPKRQRACIVLRYYEDLTEQQCAQTLGVSVGTIKSQTHKALKRLETELGGDSDER